MTDILGLTKRELSEVLTGYGEKSFRTKQIFAWLHARGVKSFDEMTDISKSLRERLSVDYYICIPWHSLPAKICMRYSTPGIS